MVSEQQARIVGRDLSREYDYRPVFSGLSLDVTSGDVLCITGENGSGKSTLIRLLCNVLRPTEGRVQWSIDSNDLIDESLLPHLGLVAPYLQLYTEFSLDEHLEISSRMRGVQRNQEEEARLIRAFGIADRQHDLLSSFSSGMLQRARLILAMSHRPSFLLLDEPTTNLDNLGIDAYRGEIARHSDSRLTIIATNAQDDLALATHRLDLGERGGFGAGN